MQNTKINFIAENNSLERPSTFLNCVKSLLVKKGLSLVAQKILYTAFLQAKVKKNKPIGELFESAIKAGRSPISFNLYSKKGKKFKIPGVTTVDKSRIEFIKLVINTVKQNLTSLKIFPEQFLNELENICNSRGPVVKGTQELYREIKKTSFIGRSTFFKKSKPFKNATNSKKKIFKYI